METSHVRGWTNLSASEADHRVGSGAVQAAIWAFRIVRLTASLIDDLSDRLS